MELNEIRKHEMYRVLLNTSKLYEDEFDSIRNNLNNETILLRSQERLQLIADVLAEVCGLTRQRHGEIKNRE